jgi:hypothetical protein
MSDHMLTIEWTTEGKWGKPKIIPYQDLKISPAASCLHYGAFMHVMSYTLFWDRRSTKMGAVSVSVVVE